MAVQVVRDPGLDVPLWHDGTDRAGRDRDDREPRELGLPGGGRGQAGFPQVRLTVEVCLASGHCGNRTRLLGHVSEGMLVPDFALGPLPISRMGWQRPGSTEPPPHRGPEGDEVPARHHTACPDQAPATELAALYHGWEPKPPMTKSKPTCLDPRAGIEEVLEAPTCGASSPPRLRFRAFDGNDRSRSTGIDGRREYRWRITLRGWGLSLLRNAPTKAGSPTVLAPP